MLHASLSASLGSLFVLLAGANVWVMLHASSRSKDPAAHARLMRAHRLGGYTFILLFCALFYFMALRIKGASDELPMFLHHAMSFDARRELLDYGYACGQRTAAAAPPSPSAQRGFLP